MDATGRVALQRMRRELDELRARLDALVAASDEAAQDAVGSILTDSATIDFTYTDATPAITASVIDGSITATKLQDGAALAEILDDDGAGSLLDADKLDGQEGAYYLPAASYTAADVLAKVLTVDGSGSTLDADTLDGHDTSYFLAASGYTAADVLTKLLTVDGTGSLLDADLLDGNHSTAFAAASHTQTAATITDFNSAARVAVASVLVDSSTTQWVVGGGAVSIEADVVTDSISNTLLANMAQATIKGRAAAAGTGDPTDLTAAQVATIVNSSIDHGSIDGLSDDDHTQYALLAGRSGGQTLKGDTASGGNLTLMSTNHATKGKLLIGTSAYDEVNNRLGVGTASPTQLIDVSGATTPAIAVYETGTVSAGDGGALLMQAANSGGTRITYAGIKASAQDGTVGAEQGALVMNVMKAGALTEVARLTQAGRLGVGVTGPSVLLQVAGTIAAAGDDGGVASTNGLTNVSNTSANSTGVGTIKFKGATNRDSTGFIKIYVGTTAYYVPFFSAITG